MITFLLGLALGTIFGATGLVCVAIMYDKHHPDKQQKGERYADKEQKAERLRYSSRRHRKTECDAERLPGRVRIPAYQCRLVSLPEEHGDSGYGYREYLAPEKLQKDQQRKIYPDEPEGLLRIQAQDRRCTV